MKLFVILVVVFLGFPLEAISLGYWVSSISCKEKAISFKISEYDLFSGCMVMHNDKWLPLDNIRGFDDK